MSITYIWGLAWRKVRVLPPYHSVQLVSADVLFRGYQPRLARLALEGSVKGRLSDNVGPLR